jgi:TatD DNase family protein
MTMRLLDTHCHLDVYADPVGVLAMARDAGIDVVAVAEDPGRFRLLRTRLGRQDGIRLGIGLHPLRVTERYRNDLDRFRRLIPDADWVGEVGLDFSRTGVATKALQLKAFDEILAIEAVRQRPLTVHSRGAERDTVTRLLEAHAVAVMHWYTGPLDVAERALAGGLWFSINPAMLKSARAAPLLQAIPPHHVLLETDGPFAKVGGRPARPTDLPAVVAHLAGIWQLPRDTAVAQISDNQRRVMSRLRPIAPGEKGSSGFAMDEK